MNIYSTGLSDITPMDAYALIQSKYKQLDLLFHPCEKFKMVYMFYMNPFYLIHVNKYHKKAIEVNLLVKGKMKIQNKRQSKVENKKQAIHPSEGNRICYDSS